MEEKMKKEIDAVITEHMPAALGKALQTRLTELESKEKLLVATALSLENSQKQASELQSLVNEMNQRVAKAATLDQREIAVATREANQQVFELQTRLEASEKSNEKVMGFVAALMRNTEFRKNAFFTNDHHFKPDGSRDSTPMSENTEKEAH